MGVLIARGWRARCAEVSIFPREPARASLCRKVSPVRAPWEPGQGGTNPMRVWPEPGERGEKHRDGQAPQQRYQTRALAARGPGRLFLAHIKHAQTQRDHVRERQEARTRRRVGGDVVLQLRTRRDSTQHRRVYDRLP
jgi:hypothetical protein